MSESHKTLLEDSDICYLQGSVLVQYSPPVSCYKHQLSVLCTYNRLVLPGPPSLSRKLLMMISALVCDAVWFSR